MQDDLRYFELLKMKIVKTLRLTYPSVPDNIKKWRKQTINHFQEDLRDKEKDLISERWFYNHMKSSQPSLPRIDILNLLSRYVGCKDWNEFKFLHQDKVKEIGKDASNRIFLIVPLLVILSLAGFFAVYKLLSNRDYQFCFVNTYDMSPVTEEVEMEILSGKEFLSPLISDSKGCIVFQTDQVQIKYEVRSIYFRNGTFTTNLDKSSRYQTIPLKADDFVVMFHDFTSAEQGKRKEQKKQLEQILADSVRIYEVSTNIRLGISLYNKQEFMEKLDFEGEKLRTFEILETEYERDKIVLLRFQENSSID